MERKTFEEVLTPRRIIGLQHTRTRKDFGPDRGLEKLVVRILPRKPNVARELGR